jgi:hypothetical protein
MLDAQRRWILKDADRAPSEILRRPLVAVIGTHRAGILTT